MKQKEAIEIIEDLIKQRGTEDLLHTVAVVLQLMSEKARGENQDRLAKSSMLVGKAMHAIQGRDPELEQFKENFPNFMKQARGETDG